MDDRESRKHTDAVEFSIASQYWRYVLHAQPFGFVFRVVFHLDELQIKTRQANLPFDEKACNLIIPFMTRYWLCKKQLESYYTVTK